MHVCRIIPSTVGDIAPLDEGSYCADDALDSAFAQLDVSVQSQDAAVKLQSAVLPVDVPVPQLPSLGVARLSKPLMLAGIEHVLDGLHDWSGFWHTAVPPAQLTAELCEILLMGSHGEPFAAATLSQYLPAWQRWLEMQHGVIPHSETVRCMIWEGVKVHLCAPEAASQRRHPRYAQLIKGGTALLRKGMAASAVQSALLQREPPPVRLPNHPSAREHAQFVADELANLQRTGAVRQTSALGLAASEKTQFDVAVVAHPLAVVVQSSGKRRLIIDARIANLYRPYEPLKYESLFMLQQLVQPHDLMWGWDLTSGYHHLRMRSDQMRLFGFQWDGQLYVYTVLPFGWSGACLAFTRLMAAVWQPLRAQGMRLVYMLDDCGGVASTLLEAQRSMRLQAAVFSALGFVTREKKCQLAALQQLTFLGAVVDSDAMRCRIPEKKLEKVKELVERVAARQEPIDMQQLQHLTGVLMALKPMVTLAPLYLRRLYALVVIADVEQAPQKLDSGHREDLLRWRALLHDNAGKPLRARALKTVRIYGDASGIGGGAFMIDTATGHQLRIASRNWTAEQRLTLLLTDGVMGFRQMLAEQRVNAVLILPRFGSAAVWLSLMHRVLPVKRMIAMAYRPGLYWTGLRAPEWLSVRKSAMDFYLVVFH